MITSNNELSIVNDIANEDHDTNEAVKRVEEAVEPEHQQSRENEGEQRAGEHHAPRSEIRLCEAGIEGGDDGNTNSNGHSCQDNLSLQEKARGSNEYGQDDGVSKEGNIVVGDLVDETIAAGNTHGEHDHEDEGHNEDHVEMLQVELIEERNIHEHEDESKGDDQLDGEQSVHLANEAQSCVGISILDVLRHLVVKSRFDIVVISTIDDSEWIENVL